jgi:hypothetical protein
MALPKPCIGNAGDACGLCGQGRLSESCDPNTQQRTCEISRDVCEPMATKMFETSTGDPGDQDCGNSCTWSSCVARPKPCIGNAGDACGLCGRGRLSESCDPSTQLRTCQIDGDVCDPASGPRMCRTPGGDPGNQTCSDRCSWSECVATVRPCNGTAGAPCGLCGLGKLSESCNDTTRERTCEGVPDGACDPSDSRPRACTTNGGQAGEQTCGDRTCAWGNCVATAAACIGNAGDPCGPCERGALSDAGDTNTGLRTCRVPPSVCEPGTRGGTCQIVIGDGPTIPGREVCSQSCAFECQEDPVVN